MIPDYFRVTAAHDTVLDCAVLFTITLRDDNVQEFDTRGDDVLESLNKLRIRESFFIKKKNRCPMNKNIEDDGEEKKRSETPIAKL